VNVEVSSKFGNWNGLRDFIWVLEEFTIEVGLQQFITQERITLIQNG
jgi:hypothetical protein